MIENTPCQDLPDSQLSADDSVWEEEQDFDGLERDKWEDKLSQVEWSSLKDKFGKLGIREGILTTKDSHGQPGFDQGFVEGIKMGRDFGVLQGASYLLSQLSIKSPKNQPENQEGSLDKIDFTREMKRMTSTIHELDSDDVLDKDYFEQNPNKEEDLDEKNGSKVNQVKREELSKDLEGIEFIKLPSIDSKNKASTLYENYYNQIRATFDSLDDVRDTSE